MRYLRYLRELEEKNEQKEEGREEGLKEGREEGREEINQLVARLIADGRTEDLLKSTQDREYQKKLMKEYQIGAQSK